MIKNIGNFFSLGKKKLNKENTKRIIYSDSSELCWTDSELIWSKNSCLLHHIHTPGRIEEALLCNIGEIKYLAILYLSGLNLYSISGQVFMIPLPFQISRIISLHKALLLIRSNNSTFFHPQYSDFPVLFTLFHPLEEIRPVAFNNINFRSPKPKYTTISSPKPMHSFDQFDAPKVYDGGEVFFITDTHFEPLFVANGKSYLLAQADGISSIWKFNEPSTNRDLLYHSPKFGRTPSIFSPKKALSDFGSPGFVAQSDIKATLEGIPPDLYMQVLYEFPHVFCSDKCVFLEIADSSKKYILCAQDSVLYSIDISYIDSFCFSEWAQNVSSICRYQDLMYFTINNQGLVSIMEETRLLMNIVVPFTTGVSAFGSRYIFTERDGSELLYLIEMSKEYSIIQTLSAAHSTLSKEIYATIILALSSSDCLMLWDSFYKAFFGLLSFIESDSEMISLFNALHYLFEDTKISRSRCNDSKKILQLVTMIARHLGMVKHIQYYALNGMDIDNSPIEPYSFEGEVVDLVSWCAHCLSGQNLLDILSPYEFSKKIITVYSAISNSLDPKDIVIICEKSKLSLELIDDYIPSLSAPLFEAFSKTAIDPPSDWPQAAYKLIKRSDIWRLLEYIKDPSSEEFISEYKMPDMRFLEVEKLLQSHLPVTVDVERPNGTDDIVYQKMLISKLKVLLSKQWSTSVARGFFNLGLWSPFSSESMKFQTLNTKGYTINGVEVLDSDEKADNSFDWAQFHAGVAIGLSVINADHSWIMTCLSQNDGYYTPGAIFGFGVSGLLKKLWKVDIFQYLSSPDIKEVNIVSMLLGLGVSYCGTKDLGISHMLTLHIPELRQYQQNDFEISTRTRSAAILGLGFLFESSANRHLSENFLKQLEKSVISDTPVFSLSLGLSIGLINLGLGDKSPVMKEIREKLTIIIIGSKCPQLSSEKVLSFGNADYFSIAPAAIMALALGYMRTDHQRVKSALAIPLDADYILTMVPDVVMMRQMAYLLIDSDPSSALNFNIPPNMLPDLTISMATGFALACGIKFVGTMDKHPYKRLMSIARCLALMDNDPFDCSDCTTIYREQCLSLVVLSCSLIIAGTCNVDFLKFVRTIKRRRILSNMNSFNYNFHMVLSMAIGIAFLGKGRYTLGNSIHNVATILLAIYPRFPRFGDDNEYQLQPMRHLLAAAAVPRVIEVRDVDTNDIVNTIVTIRIKGQKSLPIHTPHVLPPLSTIDGISIEDDSYFSIQQEHFPFKDENIRPVFWVKKKSLSYERAQQDLKTSIRMSNSNIFKTNLTKEMEIEKIEKEVLFEHNIESILTYFRASDSDERLQILQSSQPLRDFLTLYGISPSCAFDQLNIIDDGALSILIPYMNQNELTTLFSS